ncbi:Putative multidrug export ATP-binding/permease protein [Paenibacillus auburnensis]|uniref:Multidrug export ATP-binding/permease protein n=1 Tax=Paenibacillus auburnensis TaxID=2905649 RepID=A0ABN8FYI3_9BACL|nr:ABC transporter ATP-binding protein [Paenibacillus auburnensis]CAH1194912.1 Putative multidrug export ATP-binding/permease protein [Paenibacillus auburnensis]
MEQTREGVPDYEQLFMSREIKKDRPFHTLILLYRGMRINLLVSLLFYILKHAPTWVIPVITADIINHLSRPDLNSLRWLWIDLAIVSVVIVQNIPSAYMHVSFMSRSSRQVEAGLRGTLIRKLQHLSMTYHTDLRAGRLQSKVLRDVEAIETLSKQMMYSFVPAVTNVLIATTITAFKSLQVTLFFVLVIPFGVLLITFFRKKIRTRNREFRRQIENMSGQVAETVEMIPVTRAHGLEEVEIGKVDTTLSELKGKGYRLDITEALFGASSWVVFTLFQLLCLGFTCVLAYQGKIQVGDVVMYQGFFSTILASINSLLGVYPQFARGFESIYSISEVLTSTQIEEYQGTAAVDSLRGAYEFRQVQFSYKDTDKHVLKDFNLTVRPGECIALVGESGAGKSTVLNMVVGFYRPTCGRILVDGRPLEELDMRMYRQKLAVVPQSTVLFSGTIRSNITFGLTDVPDSKLEEVIRLANLQDVIAQMPQGIDTLIGEHGGKLSGGQRQRIAIARAMIRDPEIILLDEATSALDNISEFIVQKAMRELMRGRTTFIVAHRLSTIRDADRIVVMKDGQVAEAGTFEELMSRKGAFYELKQLQG